jgi:polysaccharide biosynthesis transport protein
MAEESEDAKLHFLDYWRVIRSRKEIILAVVLLVTLTGVAYTLALPPTYRASSRIEVRDDLSPDFNMMGDTTLDRSMHPVWIRTQFVLIQAKPILYEVVKTLKLNEKWGEKLNKGQPLKVEDAGFILSKCIKVEQFRDTTLIEIQAYREDPEEARDIANQVAWIYRDQRITEETTRRNRAQETFANEMKKQEDRVQEADAETERIRKEFDISLAQRGVPFSRNLLIDLMQKRSTTKIEMQGKQARWELVKDLEGDDLIYSTVISVVDPTLQVLRKQTADSEIELRQLQQNFGEKHPDVLRAQAVVDELKKKVSSALQGVKKGIHAEYEVVKSTYDSVEKEYQEALASEKKDTSIIEQKLKNAEQIADREREILAGLRAKQAARAMDGVGPRTPVRIVEPAETPARPVSPNMMLNILLSLFLGIGAGIGLAYFIEYLDTSVKTVDDVERYLGLPVLGVIPQKVRPLSELGPDSPHAEAYRVLRTNMQFANKGLQGGAFSLVSGGVGEGKSTTIFNLAYVCAQLGDKVLVVDSDLRRPVQHTFLGISNRIGLTNVLLRDVPIEETIKATSIPNLHFLPSGKLPRSSIGLLDSTRMRELVKNLKARYDYVFFDSPPIVGVSDASILASEVDGVLLVVQYRKYPRSISLRAKRMLENVGTNIVGVVLNNINILRDDYYYYYHSYYSHYDRSEDSKPSDAEVEVASASGKDKKPDSF